MYYCVTGSSMISKIICCLFICLLSASSTKLHAQSYQAINGSTQAGSMAVINNPAAALYIPFAWDITPIAIHAKQTTNAITVKNFSLFSSGKNSDIEAVPGTAKRYILANQEIRLLNTRIRLNKKNAIAFRAVIRSYFSALTSPLTFRNRFKSLYDFMDLNYTNNPISGKVRAASWAEISGTYARNFVNNDNAIINGGITLKLNRSLAGGWINFDNITYAPAAVNNRPAYLLQSGNLQYGYSANIDELYGNEPNKAKRFLKKTFSTISASIGIEYIVPVEKEGDEKNDYNYDFKLGVSLLDIGYNKYGYSTNSKVAVHNKDNISDSLLEASFSNIKNLDAVDDSLAAIAGPLGTLAGNFNIIQPTRLVINADKYLADNFFINAELTLPVASLLATDRLVLSDMNLLAITPRYETKTLGVYFPITFNTQKQLWISGAFKLGPLLLGIHNWGNLFSKNKIQKGGGYIALTFRPGKNNGNREKRGLTKEEKKQLRLVGCPKF